jgi:hypothetical protein
MDGALTGFQFYDDDDHSVNRTLVGVSDGATTTYTLKRYRGSYVGGSPVGLESIGVLDTTQTFNLYVDASRVPIDPIHGTYAYTLDTSTPKNQKVVFGSAPAAGHTFTCDMSFFYYVRFQADSLDFEKFMHQLWTLNKVTLQSLRF